MLPPLDLDAYLADCRSLVLEQLRAQIARRSGPRRALYDLVLDYPLRPAKGLRPALCIATCRSLGGSLEAALPSASVLELYHNAFLIHDDVEDGSEKRRDLDTLHRTQGVPIAVNVGDAMLAMALEPLLDNMHVLDMGRALRILETVSVMARESAEGQAVELDWVRHARWDATDAEYLAMVDQKTGWYSFVAPMTLGALCANAPRAQVDALGAFALKLGAAFQIIDDVLNLMADAHAYGKEIAGDLWEGKHTLIVLHTLRCMGDADRREALAILGKARPSLSAEAAHSEALIARLQGLERAGQLGPEAREALRPWLGRTPQVKTDAEVRWLLAQIERHGSLDYARALAVARAREAGAMLAEFTWIEPSIHRQVLEGVVEYVVARDR
ncbi:MAG: polyprenyl synthetase family protein [Myxococcales bacterium]|nr:polyprenyl synthetase family protein [Myxococcales bacterium]